MAARSENDFSLINLSIGLPRRPPVWVAGFDSENHSKMKKLSPLLIACLFATTASPVTSAAETQADSADDVSRPDPNASAMTGTYVGTFGTGKITISLDRVIGKTVSGYSIVAGNERAFSGSWQAVDGAISVVAKEPGDDPADGTFRFTFTGSPKSIRGVWTPNDAKIGDRKFNLPARIFKYNAKAGKYPQTSTKRLKEADVENLKPAELRIMRNEIYARHGYSFKLADMRNHFEALDWYMPMALDVTTQLTATEKNNAALLKRYEKYTDEYYDQFGR
jgi:hypothetical protein